MDPLGPGCGQRRPGLPSITSGAADDEVETLNASEELHERSGWRRGVRGEKKAEGKKHAETRRRRRGLSAASPLC